MTSNRNTPAPNPRGIEILGEPGRAHWDAFDNDGGIFVFIKASEGERLADPRFVKNWQFLKEKGLHRGAFHLYLPGAEPAAQALLFERVLDFHRGDLPPIINLEKLTFSDLECPSLKLMLHLVEATFRLRPLLLIKAGFDQMDSDRIFPTYPRWIPDREFYSPFIPDRWPIWRFWG